jgi:TetR/AcrR family transcriptional repressor of nem operon
MAKAIASESTDTRDNILAAGQRMMAAKGFTAVGLNEILTSSGVPKGSFYHYFSSKEAYGEALLHSYFDEYLADIDRTLAQPKQTMAQRLMNYFASWRDTQSFLDCQGKCLAVKLGAEVADMSEPMRLAMKQGTSGSSTDWPRRSRPALPKARSRSTKAPKRPHKASINSGWARV